MWKFLKNLFTRSKCNKCLYCEKIPKMNRWSVNMVDHCGFPADFYDKLPDFFYRCKIKEDYVEPKNEKSCKHQTTPKKFFNQ